MTKPKRKHVRTRPRVDASAVTEPNARTSGAASVSDDTARSTADLPPSGSSPGGGTPPANPLGELAPAIETETPDAQAAFASLEPPAEPAPSSELPPPAPGEPVRQGPPKYTPPNKADLPPGYVHWGDKKLREKRKGELITRVQDLQKQLETRPALTPADVAAEPVTIEECRELIARVMPAVDSLVVFALGDTFQATPKDLELLVSTTAPVVFPHYATLKARLPWIPAGVALLAVYTPKVVEKLKEERKRKRAAAAGIHESDARSDAAASADGSRVFEFPATRQYGGPNE